MATKKTESDYDKHLREVMNIAWEHAAAAMRTIAEAAADGDVGAAYYLVNRTIGRPVEAEKQDKSDDYGDLLRDLRKLRTSGEGGPEPSADSGGAPAPVAAGGVPPVDGAVRSASEPVAPEANRRRRTRRKELLSGDGADS